MFESLKQKLSQLKEAFGAMSAVKKVAIFAAVALLLSGLIVFAMHGKKAEFKLLYQNLEGKDASAVVAVLNEKKIPYELRDNGQTILVPPEHFNIMRLELAGRDLPLGGSGMGFELFDKTQFGTTEYVQKLNYIRALQGEISRTINQLAEVESSRVHIVIPKTALFSEDQKTTTASIILTMKRGKKLRPEQVKGIVNFVAGSIEGLDPKNITVVDNSGNILEKEKDKTDAQRLTSYQQEMQQDMEQKLEDKIRAMMEKITGQGKA
ncbi:MAG: flagellar M-ring protein FliF, partial [Deltaproteobacteria bacterium]|nr:flagellar M-ring protein FliF [Deltaproteobacteria bacterium]